MVGFRPLAILAVGIVAGLQAQTPGDNRPAVIRAEAREVLVDVTVTGRKSVPTGDLAATDFSVWEDGKLQKINAVSIAGADPKPSRNISFSFSISGLCRRRTRQPAKNTPRALSRRCPAPIRDMAVVKLHHSRFPLFLQNFTAANAPLIKAIELPFNSSTVNGRQVGFFSQAGLTGAAALALSLTAAADRWRRRRGGRPCSCLREGTRETWRRPPSKRQSPRQPRQCRRLCRPGTCRYGWRCSRIALQAQLQPH